MPPIDPRSPRDNPVLRDAVISPNEVEERIRLAGEEYVNLKHAADLLEKTEKSVLAELTNQVRRENPAMSRREAEDIARGSKEYQDHLYAAADARHKAGIARVHYEAARAWFEAGRSASATNRALMTMR